MTAASVITEASDCVFAAEALLLGARLSLAIVLAIKALDAIEDVKATGVPDVSDDALAQFDVAARQIHKHGRELKKIARELRLLSRSELRDHLPGTSVQALRCLSDCNEIVAEVFRVLGIHGSTSSLSAGRSASVQIVGGTS